MVRNRVVYCDGVRQLLPGPNMVARVSQLLPSRLYHHLSVRMWGGLPAFFLDRQEG